MYSIALPNALIYQEPKKSASIVKRLEMVSASIAGCQLTSIFFIAKQFLAKNAKQNSIQQKETRFLHVTPGFR